MSADNKQFDLFGAMPLDYRKKLQPGRTAMQRKEASPVARYLLSCGALERFKVQTILDFGCGRGQDVQYYCDNGYRAVGYDPHPDFGHTEMPAGKFDLVSCLFVLNVIADLKERHRVCEQIFDKVKKLGLIALAARSPHAIEKEASRKGWLRFADGYLSSPQRGTFQRGISEDEIITYFNSSAISLVPATFPGRPDVCARLLQKM